MFYLFSDTIEYSIVDKSMGNSQTPGYPTCNLISRTSTYSTFYNHSRKNGTNALPSNVKDALQNQLSLADFERSLTTSECFYVFSSLLQQYYSVFKQQGRVFVYAHLCIVNEFGQIKLQQKIDDIPDFTYAISLISILSQVMELVQKLARQSEWISEDDYFYQKMLKTIYKFHSDQNVLYRQIRQELFSYMQCKHFRDNLLPAILRLNQPLQDPFLKRKQVQKRHETEPFESFTKIKKRSLMKYSGFVKKQASFTLFTRQSDNKSTTYYRRKTQTGGEEYSLNTETPSLFQQKTTIHSHSITAGNNKNYISSQYSMNISNSNERKQLEGKTKVKFKNLTQKLDEQHQNRDNFGLILRRNNTTNGILYEQLSKKSHTKVKSTLQDLARSVIVRDVPSSKKFTF